MGVGGRHVTEGREVTQFFLFLCLIPPIVIIMVRRTYGA